MAATSAGSIVYDVGLDIRGLQSGLSDVQNALNGMNRTVDINTRHLNSMQNQMNAAGAAMRRLSGIAASLAAALSVQQIAQYADAWVTVNNKLANAIRPTETLADVTQRVFDISQRTLSSLDATAALYGRLERATRSAGTSTEDLVKLTETINKGLAVSGATTQEASSAMIQLSQALASGVLRGEEFNSISENGSRLAVGLADSLGVTVGQLRSMAAEGKLTTDVVVKGLLTQGDQIAKEFANTAMTMGQAFSVATNNITKFVGESSTIKSAYSGFNSTVVTISENIDVLASAVTIAAAVVGSRFAGALAMATVEKVKSIAATRQLIVAENQAAQSAALQATSALRSAEAAKLRALEEVRLAQMMKVTATSSANLALAEQALSTARVSAATATGQYNAALLANKAAQDAATAAASRASIASGLLRGALGLIGGPVGAAMLAGAAIFYFWQQSKAAREEAEKLADGVDNLTAKMKDMSQVQLSAEIAKLRSSIPELTDAVNEAQEAYDKATSKVKGYQKEIDNWGESTKRGRQAQEAMGSALDNQAIAADNLQAAQNRLSRVNSTVGIAQAELNGQLRQGIDLLKRNGDEVGVVAGMMNQLGRSINFASAAKEKFNSQSLKVDRPVKVQDFLDKQSQQIELQSELNARKREQLKAEQEIRALGGSDADIRMARERAGAEYDALEAQRASKKGQKEGESAAKKAATAQESIAKKLQKMKEASEVAADSTKELSKEQAILRAEQSLGKSATDEQIKQAGEYAAKTWDLTEGLKAQVAADKARQDLQKNFKGIQAQASPVTGLDAQFKEQMLTVNQYAMAYPAKVAEAEAARAVIEKQYRDQRTALMWAEWKEQSDAARIFGETFDASLSTVSNSLTGILTGTQSVNDALANIATTVLNTVVNSFIQMGAEQVRAAVMGAAAQQSAITATAATQVGAIGVTTAASTASASTTLAAWLPAALVASVGSFGAAAIIGGAALVGAFALSKTLGRKNGGPMAAGSMYEVGEGNLPEIFQASNGKQYMTPGNGGRMFSNKDVTSGGGSGGGLVVYNNITNNTNSNVSSSATQNADGSVTISTIVDDIRNGGEISQSISGTFDVQRKANE